MPVDPAPSRSPALANFLFRAMAPRAFDLGATIMMTGLADYRGFCRGLDLARDTFGDWNMRDPINDLKDTHAGAVAFRSVFA